MSIRVQYEPVQGMAAAALLAGRGQYAERRDQRNYERYLNDQKLAMAAQESQQRAQQLAQANAQDDARLALAQQQMQFGQARDVATYQQQQAQNAQQRERQASLDLLNQNEQTARLKLAQDAAQAQKDQFKASQLFTVERDAAQLEAERLQQVEAQVGDARTWLMKNEFIGPAKAKANELASKLVNITDRRADHLTPEYTANLEKWMGEMQAARLEELTVKPPPTLQELEKSHIVERADGSKYILSPDRSKITYEPPPPPVKPEKTPEGPKGFGDYYADIPNYNKAFRETEKILYERAQRENERIAMEKGDDAPAATARPTAAEVNQELQRMQAAQRSLLEGVPAPPEQTGQTGVAPPPAAEYKPPSQKAVEFAKTKGLPTPPSVKPEFVTHEQEMGLRELFRLYPDMYAMPPEARELFAAYAAASGFSLTGN